jgi:hypothetical protein
MPARPAFIEPDIDAPPQFNAADVLEQEQASVLLRPVRSDAGTRQVCATSEMLLPSHESTSTIYSISSSRV